MAPLDGFLELALFAGAGGGILGGHILGTRCIGAVEIEPYPRSVLHARQDDGTLPPFPIWDDIRTFRSDNPECAEYLRGLRTVSDRLVVSGGFPCQDISCAGRGAGIDGERSGLWGEMFRVVCEVGPRFVFVENSPMLTSRGLGRVLGDMASVGYDAEWTVLGSDDVGAPHRRKRIWILANTPGRGWPAGIPRCGEAKSGRAWDTVTGSDPLRDEVADSSLGRLSQPRERKVQLSRRTEAVGSSQVSHPNLSGREHIRPIPGGCYEGAGTSREQERLPVMPGYGGDGQKRDVADSHGSGGDQDRSAGELRTSGAEQPSEDPGYTTAGEAREVRSGRPVFGWWDIDPGEKGDDGPTQSDLGRMVDGMAPGLDLHGAHASINVARVAHGIPDRANRLRAIGNGQVPACAAEAFMTLMERIQ